MEQEMDFLGFSKLHKEMVYQDFNKIKRLVENGADVNVRNKHQGTPLHTICIHPNIRMDIVKYLVENGADVNAADDENDTPLYFASKMGKDEIVKYLIAKGADTAHLYIEDEGEQDTVFFG